MVCRGSECTLLLLRSHSSDEIQLKKVVIHNKTYFFTANVNVFFAFYYLLLSIVNGALKLC